MRLLEQSDLGLQCLPWSTSQNTKNQYSNNEPPHDKTNKMIYAPSEDSDQPGHPPSLIRVFAVHSVGSWGPNLSSCGQWRLWSDWTDAQADLSLLGAQIILLVLSWEGSINFLTYATSCALFPHSWNKSCVILILKGKIFTLDGSCSEDFISPRNTHVSWKTSLIIQTNS